MIKELVPHRVVCPYCNKVARLVDSSIIYSKSFGMVYLCVNYPKCDSYVGVHKGTTIPLGRMANRELREWKKSCHYWFDKLWKSGIVRREDAYKFIQRSMNLPASEAHIGMFTVEQCRKFHPIIADKVKKIREIVKGILDE